jgi:glycosyltransferase involved in cell wall biosynthesis
MSNLDVSVVVPLYNEEESLEELFDWIRRVTDEHNLETEVVFVDDGSRDGSWKIIEGLCSKDRLVKGLKFRRNYGKSAALNAGFEAASGEVVITMDADLQDSPDEIPGLHEMIMEEGYDLVSGWKKRRHDPLSKTFPSKFFNFTTRLVSGIRLHDFNCGLKAYRLDVVKSIEVYGEMHRYIPVIAKAAGFNRIGEKVVTHYKRKYGTSKYGMGRLIKGYLDLLSITFISRFGRRPMHFFGGIGTLMFFLGFVAAIYLGALKLYNLAHGIKSVLIADSPYFYLALAAMIIGSQLFLTGFLAELITRTATERNMYLLENQINMERDTG